MVRSVHLLPSGAGRGDFVIRVHGRAPRVLIDIGWVQ